MSRKDSKKATYFFTILKFSLTLYYPVIKFAAMKLYFKITNAFAAWVMIILVLLLNIINISHFSATEAVLGANSPHTVPELLPANDIVFQINWYEKPSPKTAGFFQADCHPILKQSINSRIGEKIRAIKVFRFNLANFLSYNTPYICYKFPLSEHSEAG